MSGIEDERSIASAAAPAVAIALLAGACGGIQPKINAVLGARLGSSIVASLVNFCVAFTAVLVVLSLRPGTRAALRDVRSWPVPRWTLTAGLGGALAVVASVVAVETIGVGIFSVAFFGGQISAGLLVDRLGVGAGGARPFIATRMQAAVVALAAVGVSQVGRPVGEFEPALVAFVALAGAVSAFQSAFNGRIARSVGDAFAATAVNVAVGLSALAAIVCAVAVTGRLPDGGLQWPTEPWLYAGGTLGVTIVLSLAIASAAMGVLRATVSMLAAQLVTALLVDWLVEHDPPTFGVIAGAALIVGAVALVGRAGGGAVAHR